MSDPCLNYYVSRGTTTQRNAFTPTPATPAAGPSPGYLWWDTTLQEEFAYDFLSTAWVSTGGSGSGTVTHSAGSLTSGQLVYGNAGADIKVVAATDGQIPIGKTSDGTAAFHTLTAGTGITVTNAGNSVTITATGSSVGVPTFAFFAGT